MNFEYIEKITPLYLDAGLLVLQLGSLGILGALALGKIVAITRYYKVPILSQIFGFYVELSRNTPLLIQLFFLYFGLPKIGLSLDPEICGVIGLIFLGGGYFAESFRSGYDGVEKGQVEAAASLGLAKWRTFFRIIAPQSLRLSFASLGANVIFLLKETSMFSAVTLMDLTFVAKQQIGMHYNSSESLLLLVIGYGVILVPLVVIFALIERHLHNSSGLKSNKKGGVNV